ncbi:hypothetical protein GQ53DRAFT_888837 [Thozetella sp. PMI_491]|nr:hypothetical protein GQ53DRAFT_888837 [Thozetella sp. PMI_491]
MWRAAALATLLCLFILIGFLISTVVQLAPNFRQGTAQIFKSPCGSTPSEAKARGCHFDIISFCWLHEQCYDAELTRLFDSLAHWEWYYDPNKTQRASREDVELGQLTNLYVSEEYHHQHCAIMWLKMHRAIIGLGKPAIDSYMGNLDHTKHCASVFGHQDEPMDSIDTIIRLKFPDCGIE